MRRWTCARWRAARPPSVLLAAVAAALALAAPARAADVTYDGAGLQVRGAPGEASRLTVDFEPNLRATVHDDAHGLRPGPGCLGSASDVTCGLLGPQCFPCSARIDLGDGDDTLTLSGTSQKGPFSVDAGAGDDDVHVTGEADAIVDGGPGADTLRADAISELDGGAGPDRLEGDRAVATYATRATGVVVTLDGVANDGAPGEGDDVETHAVLGGDGADELTGGDGADELSGHGGDDVLRGGGGDDMLRGESGADHVDAGAGDDRVEGSAPDTVSCGPGDDVAAGFTVPTAFDDCETVFETVDEPYLTLGAVTLQGRRPAVAVGWHPLAGPAGPPVSASGVVEARHRGVLVARGSFAGLLRPAGRTVALRFTARGRRLACRAALAVRLLAVASGRTEIVTPLISRSAIRATARLPRARRCRG